MKAIPGKIKTLRNSVKTVFKHVYCKKFWNAFKHACLIVHNNKKIIVVDYCCVWGTSPGWRPLLIKLNLVSLFYFLFRSCSLQSYTQVWYTQFSLTINVIFTFLNHFIIDHINILIINNCWSGTSKQVQPIDSTKIITIKQYKWRS